MADLDLTQEIRALRATFADIQHVVDVKKLGEEIVVLKQQAADPNDDPLFGGSRQFIALDCDDNRQNQGTKRTSPEGNSEWCDQLKSLFYKQKRTSPDEAQNREG